MTDAKHAALVQSLRTPGVVVERHRGIDIMPDSIVVALDRDPSILVRQVVPLGRKMPAVGDAVVLVRTKAGTIYTFETVTDAH